MRHCEVHFSVSPITASGFWSRSTLFAVNLHWCCAQVFVFICSIVSLLRQICPLLVRFGGNIFPFIYHVGSFDTCRFERGEARNLTSENHSSASTTLSLPLTPNSRPPESIIIQISEQEFCKPAGPFKAEGIRL